MTAKFNKVKERLAELQELADEADNRTAQAKHDLREALSRLEKAEGEVGTHKRRTQLLVQELNTNQQRYDERAERLEKVLDEINVTEERRKELEENEQQGDERLQDLEEEVKLARQVLEENEVKLVEVQRKAVVLKRDITRVQEFGDSCEKRVEVLEDTISSTGENLRSLEERETESCDKEAFNEEKIAFLCCQIKEVDVRVEAAERQVQNLERVILDTDNEKNNWISKRQAIESEMDNIEGVDDWLEME
eukprot:gene13861-15309_t